MKTDSPAPPTLTPAMTERGGMCAEFRDEVGATCSIQESSARIDGNAVWLGRETDYAGLLLRGARMHLDRGTVAALLPLLREFVETGHIGRRPPTTEPTFDPVLDENTLPIVQLLAGLPATEAATRLAEHLRSVLGEQARHAVGPDQHVIGPPRCMHEGGEMTFIHDVGLWAREECGCVAEYHFTWRAPGPGHAASLCEMERKRRAGEGT